MTRNEIYYSQRLSRKIASNPEYAKSIGLTLVKNGSDKEPVDRSGYIRERSNR